MQACTAVIGETELSRLWVSCRNLNMVLFCSRIRTYENLVLPFKNNFHAVFSFETDFYLLTYNKLRLYKTLKGSFTQESYISNIININQRALLSRFRTSAHNFRVETGRHTSPVTPLSKHVCVYCDSGECDTEVHGILLCETFELKKRCFISVCVRNVSSIPCNAC